MTQRENLQLKVGKHLLRLTIHFSSVQLSAFLFSWTERMRCWKTAYFPFLWTCWYLLRDMFIIGRFTEGASTSSSTVHSKCFESQPVFDDWKHSNHPRHIFGLRRYHRFVVHSSWEIYFLTSNMLTHYLWYFSL